MKIGSSDMFTLRADAHDALNHEVPGDNEDDGPADHYGPERMVNQSEQIVRTGKEEHGGDAERKNGQYASGHASVGRYSAHFAAQGNALADRLRQIFQHYGEPAAGPAADKSGRDEEPDFLNRHAFRESLQGGFQRHPEAPFIPNTPELRAQRNRQFGGQNFNGSLQWVTGAHRSRQALQGVGELRLKPIHSSLAQFQQI